MRQRAVHDLADLTDPEFFTELETGIGLCVANATRIMADVAALAKDGRYQSAKILQNVANEETAKALILLDGRDGVMSGISTKRRIEREIAR